MTELGVPRLAPSELAAAASACFATPVHVAIAATGAEALAGALAAARRPMTTPVWPCPYASLTHCGDVAVAVAVPLGRPADGVGVDLEFERPIRSGFARMICAAHELAWLDTLPPEARAAEVLRLWTVKEALYKADLAQGDAIVAHYAVAEPGKLHTTGARSGGEPSIVFSTRVAGGVLSIALRAPQAGVPT